VIGNAVKVMRIATGEEEEALPGKSGRSRSGKAGAIREASVAPLDHLVSARQLVAGCSLPGAASRSDRAYLGGDTGAKDEASPR
jgi:hypothetical protein